MPASNSTCWKSLNFPPRSYSSVGLTSLDRDRVRRNWSTCSSCWNLRTSGPSRLADFSLLWTTDRAATDRDLALQRGRDRDFGLALLIRAVRLARMWVMANWIETGHPFRMMRERYRAAQYADYLKEAVACVTCVAKSAA